MNNQTKELTVLINESITEERKKQSVDVLDIIDGVLVTQYYKK